MILDKNPFSNFFWIPIINSRKKAVEEYFQSQKEGFSYAHLLNQTKPMILENVTSKENFKVLDE